MLGAFEWINLTLTEHPIAKQIFSNFNVPSQTNLTPAQNANRVVTAILTELWEQIGNSTVYSGVLLVAKVFLGVGLLFVLYRTYYQLTENKIGDYRTVIAAFIWPIIAIILLVEPPNLQGQVVTRNTNIWQISLFFRNTIAVLDEAITKGIFPNGSPNPLEILSFNYASETAAINAASNCESISNIVLKLQCYQDAADGVNEAENISPTFKTMANDFVSQAQGFNLSNLGGGLNVENLNFDQLNTVLSHPFMALGRRFIEPFINTILIGLYFMFNLLIELSLLLVAILAPIAIGLSLIPLQTRSISVWLSGIVAVGMTKIAFHTIANLASLFAFDNNYSGVNTGIYLLLGVGAPFIAGAVGTFSASGIQQGVTQLATYGVFMGSGLMKVPLMFFGGGRK